MFGGGGGMNPQKLNQMMEQMGIDIEELDAEEIVIRTGDKELVFDQPEVQRMDAQGQATYTITGEPETREAGGGEEATPLGAGDDGGDSGDGDESGGSDAIPEEDIGIVAQRTGASEDDAREALEATDGDLADAVSRLE
jgi:nascent polypeptide-associated complex subunit alpha